jgi:predicted regulator of Ras-like GTPase activity (Roadblock/LC7/MglB family)
MAGSADLILSAEGEARLVAALAALASDAKARAAFLLDRNGRLLAGAGEMQGLDTTALASLASGSMAATGSLAQLVGEPEFGGLLLEGVRSHLLLASLGRDLILVVLFDRRTAPGLVRFRMRRAAQEIGDVFAAGGRSTTTPAVLAEITDEDIENLLAG